ncbi:hypothetical protein F2Q69_00021212 [Brassica cretica]|uniref:Uncharacterized protein n=1 Tax=Brassica cretica TaxID=69181 RepID=A0A8S9QIM7_BRACR|nr:hypothetical protein F2Q69_00021212 [Brassica cretica]
MTSRKRSSKKKTSPQSSSGNPCTNEDIVHKEEFEVEQEEKCGNQNSYCRFPFKLGKYENHNFPEVPDIC